jgi:hypothetical protein
MGQALLTSPPPLTENFFKKAIIIGGAINVTAICCCGHYGQNQETYKKDVNDINFLVFH